MLTEHSDKFVLLIFSGNSTLKPNKFWEIDIPTQVAAVVTWWWFTVFLYVNVSSAYGWEVIVRWNYFMFILPGCVHHMIILFSSNSDFYCIDIFNFYDTSTWTSDPLTSKQLLLQFCIVGGLNHSTGVFSIKESVTRQEPQIYLIFVSIKLFRWSCLNQENLEIKSISQSFRQW